MATCRKKKGSVAGSGGRPTTPPLRTARVSQRRTTTASATSGAHVLLGTRRVSMSR
jgi:hypothetical protein